MPEVRMISDKIFVIDQFLDKDECDQEIAHAEAIGFELAPIMTLNGPMINEMMRNNTRVMEDAPERAEALWKRAQEFVPTYQGSWKAIGLNERFRYYRYEDMQQFDWHSDGSFARDARERSLLSMLIYLNGDFKGGETSFQSYKVRPEAGRVLVFPHPLLHKGEPVSEGRKYVLRTDVMYAKTY